MTYKGQVTIPIEIRRALGLKRGDKVAFERDGDSVTIRAAHGVTERTAGILASYRKVPSPSAEEEREAFAQAVGDEVVAGQAG
jgi:AbrB family looped-hinge helix DNA binding protein